MYCLQLFHLNLVIQNSNKNTGGCLPKKTHYFYLVGFFFPLVKCKTGTFEAGREHTDFDTSNVDNLFTIRPLLHLCFSHLHTKQL